MKKIDFLSNTHLFPQQILIYYSFNLLFKVKSTIYIIITCFVKSNLLFFEHPSFSIILIYYSFNIHIFCLLCKMKSNTLFISTHFFFQQSQIYFAFNTHLDLLQNPIYYSSIINLHRCIIASLSEQSISNPHMVSA